MVYVLTVSYWLVLPLARLVLFIIAPFYVFVIHQRFPVIDNLGLVGGSISGSSYVGGLVGNNQGTVSNTYATGNVSGTGNDVGVLVGQSSGTVSKHW